MAIDGNGVRVWQSTAPGTENTAWGRVRPRTGGAPGEVRRVVNVPTRSLELVGLLDEVPAGEATLTLKGAVERRHETGAERTYRALLCFPGLVRLRQRVELDVVVYGPSVASLALRATEGLARRVDAPRYEAAAEAALAELERLLGFQAAVDAPARTDDLGAPPLATAVAADEQGERAA